MDPLKSDDPFNLERYRGTTEVIAPTLNFAEEQALGDQADAAAPSAVDLFKASAEVDHVSSFYFGAVDASAYRPDFDYDFSSLSPEQYKELAVEGRDPRLLEEYASAVSFDHAKAIKQQQDRRLEALRTLEAGGVGGFAARVVTSLFDPAALALTAVTEGVAAPYILGAKATRLGAVLKTAFLAGTSNAALEAVLAYKDPLRDETDVMFAAGAGIVLGGIGGSLLPIKDPLQTELRAAIVATGTKLETSAAENIAARAGAEEAVSVKPSITATTEEGAPRFDSEHAEAHVENLAREIRPDLYQADDALAAEMAQVRQKISTLQSDAQKEARFATSPEREALEAEYNDLAYKLRNAGARRAKQLNSRMEEVNAKLEQLRVNSTPLDSAEVSIWRNRLMDLDQKRRDLAPHVSAARRKAEARYAETLRGKGKPEAKTVEQSLSEARAARGEEPVAPPAADGESPTTTTTTTTPAAPNSVGAHGVTDYKPNPMLDAGEEDFDWHVSKQRVDPRDVKWQFDLYAKLAKSANAARSWFVDNFAPNPSRIRKFTRHAQGKTVAEDKEMISGDLLGGAMRVWNQAYDEWAKQTGRSFKSLNTSARQEFGELVGRAVRDHRNAPPAGPIGRAAAAVQEFHGRYAKMAKDAEVEGFLHLDVPNANYLMRIPRYAKIRELENAGMSTNDIVRLVTGALMNGPGRTKPLGQDAADELAWLYVKWIKDSATDFASGRSLAFNGSQVSNLKRRMREEVAQDATMRQLITDDKIDEFVDMVKNLGQAGTISRGKYRLDMDETFELDVTMKDGSSRRVSVSELFESNAEVLMHRYSAEMSGAIALARNPQLRIKSLAHWEAMAKRIAALDRKYQPDLIDKIEEEQDAMELLRRYAFGQPMHDMSMKNAALFRAVRDFNYVRIGNKFGLAQIAEFGNVLGGVGYRALVQQLPILSNIRRSILTGNVHSELLNEIEAIGIGLDGQLGNPLHIDAELGTGTMQNVSATQKTLAIGRKITSYTSGLVPMTIGLERIAAASAIQRLANMADSLKSATPAEFASSSLARRLKQLGMSDADALRMFGEMRSKISTVGGLTGRTVKTLNLDQWDPALADMFKTALWRWTRQLVQRTDVGDLPVLMSNPMMQLFFQFRGFTIVSYAKQFLNGARTMDAQTMSRFFHSTLFGGLGYMALVYVNSLGKDDPEKYREERLNWKNIGAMGWSRGGWSSLLPQVIDTGMAAVGQEQLFADARTSGLRNDIFANPTFDLANSAYRAVVGAGSAMARDDYDFSQSDARAWRSLLPFQNSYLIGSGLDHMIGQLPKFSTDD